MKRSKKPRSTAKTTAVGRSSSLLWSMIQRVLAPAFLLCSTLVFLAIPRIHEVQCLYADTQQPCSEQERAYFDTLEGRPLFFIDIEKIIRTDTTHAPFVITTISKTLPTTLKVRISPLEQIYTLSSNDELYGLSQTGVIIPYHTQTALHLTCQSTEMCQSNGVLSPSLLTLVELLSTHQVFSSTPLTITITTPHHIAVHNDAFPTVLITQSADSGTLDTLEALLSSPDYTQSTTTIREIDMRFRLPVLRI
ncbi:MAG: hypothetical protein H6774_03495 [Pseudomonadales bacterium]|nr:hypothetical protein [Candidatus Woesebacteria bacterium]MCB9802125.1 hypothetical protein [Pseudomonadales bacterium]